MLHLPPEALDRVRAEEAEVLRAVVAAYPAWQAWAFARNTARQLVTVGTGEVQPLVRGPDGLPETTQAMADASRPLALFDRVVQAGTLAGALLLALMLAQGATRAEVDLALMLGAGLLINAAIFGGLSVPVDRYGARVAWLVPALGALLWLARQGRRAPTPHPPTPHAARADGAPV